MAKKQMKVVAPQGNKAQQEKAKKMKPQQIATLKGIGESIVQKTVESGDSVAGMFFKQFGKSEAELLLIREGMAEAWKAALKKLKSDCVEWAGKLEGRDSQSAYAKSAQVFYNKKSEGDAILAAFSIYAALPKGKAKSAIEKDIRDMENAPRRYDTLVMYARHLKNPAKRNSGAPENAAVIRAKNAWAKKTDEQVKAVKEKLKYANLGGLLQLREYIEDRIALLKKREPATVTDISKAKRAKAINKKLRKAAGMKAAA